MIRRLSLLTVFLLLVLSCKKPNDAQLNTGIWRAELKVTDDEVLPFNFKLSNDKTKGYHMEVYNASEVIAIDDIVTRADSILIKMKVFEGYISGKFTDSTITGSFVKESLDRVVPFTAVFGVENRFDDETPATANVSGIWETEFSPDTPDSYMAKGLFSQQGNVVTGTFRTTTGDYRYLEGIMNGDSLKLSAFDGAHAFLFTAKVTDSSLAGTFYSGNHFEEPFVGIRNKDFELPDEDTLTFLKEGYDQLVFSFPDAEGTLVSLEDEMFKDKVVIVQIMGTWCPNCLDETKFFVDYIKKNGNEDLQFVALAFEYAKTKEAAFTGIKRLKERIGVPYPILLAQYGTSNKARAQEKLPMLNHVLSYPTSIFLDKKGKVRKIHTGFNGPATGDAFVAFKKEFNAFVNTLLEE